MREGLFSLEYIKGPLPPFLPSITIVSSSKPTFLGIILPIPIPKLLSLLSHNHHHQSFRMKAILLLVGLTAGIAAQTTKPTSSPISSLAAAPPAATGDSDCLADYVVARCLETETPKVHPLPPCSPWKKKRLTTPVPRPRIVISVTRSVSASPTVASQHATITAPRTPARFRPAGWPVTTAWGSQLRPSLCRRRRPRMPPRRPLKGAYAPWLLRRLTGRRRRGLLSEPRLESSLAMLVLLLRCCRGPASQGERRVTIQNAHRLYAASAYVLRNAQKMCPVHTTRSLGYMTSS